MKIGTDAVLLGTLPKFKFAERVLDIGSGTGVLSLILAQQFQSSEISAIEIDENAVKTSRENFQNSNWANYLDVIHADFLKFNFDKKFDLIISNPPYFINSLLSIDIQKNKARHANDSSMIVEWIKKSESLLSKAGKIAFILPFDLAENLKSMTFDTIYVSKQIIIKSFQDALPIRSILIWEQEQKPLLIENFIIYDQPKVYTKAYQELLKDYLTIF